MRGLALALSSSILLILAHPPFRFLVLPFVALVPLIVGVGSLGDGRGSHRKAAFLGLWFGVLHWGFLLSWVLLIVAPRFPWAFPGYGAQVFLLSGLAAGMTWVAHRLRYLARIPIFLGFPLAWVSMEWLKGHFPLGLSFPWLGLGISLSRWPGLLGMAEWTGEAGIALWLALVNALLASAVLAIPQRKKAVKSGPAPWVLVLAAGATALIPGAVGFFRTQSLPLGPGPRVTVVGTQIPRDLRGTPDRGSEEGLNQTRRWLAALDPGSTDLVVLPEATIAVPLDAPGARRYRESLMELAGRLEVPILVGGLGSAPGEGPAYPGGEEEGGMDGPLTNSAFLFGPGGSFLARYDKVRLVPGMEWGGYSKGEEARAIPVGAFGFGPLICYESLFSKLARAQVSSGADVLVNLSSDIWFGSGTHGLASLFLHQHAAHLVMRAVETRTPVARAVNGGFSFLLDPRGQSLAPPVSPPGGIAQARLPIHPSRTLFTRTGDILGPASILTALLILLSAGWRGRGWWGRWGREGEGA